MKQFAACLLLLALAVPVSAETLVLGNRIIVTDHIPDEKLPEFIKQMDAKAFEAWAKARNEKAYADAKVRHDEYLAQRAPLRTMAVSETAGSTTIRSQSRFSNGASGSTSALSGLSPVGSRVGRSGDTVTRVADFSTTRDYSITYPDLNDHGGGPVTIINPYCFDYWRVHTVAD
jgi:hypothetical protein